MSTPCASPGCPCKARYRGYCRRHRLQVEAGARPGCSYAWEVCGKTETCGLPVSAKGLCSAHYQRARREASGALVRRGAIRAKGATAWKSDRLPAGLARRLAERAELERVSRAELLRRAVEAYLAEAPRAAWRPGSPRAGRARA